MIDEKAWRRWSNDFGPENPHRFDPDFWSREDPETGKKVWAGPVSDEKWRSRYAGMEWVGRLKPAPSFNYCVFMHKQVHHDVCSLEKWDECKRCEVPSHYTFVLRIQGKLGKAVRFQLKLPKRRVGSDLLPVWRLRLRK